MWSKPSKFCFQASEMTITISDSESDMDNASESAPPAPKPPNKRYPRGFRFFLPNMDDSSEAGTGKHKKFKLILKHPIF